MVKIDKIKNTNENVDEEQAVSQEPVESVMNQAMERVKSGADDSCNIKSLNEELNNDNNDHSFDNKNRDDIMNGNQNNNDDYNDTIDKIFIKINRKTTISSDVLSVVNETDTFINEPSHNESNSGIFHIFNLLNRLMKK